MTARFTYVLVVWAATIVLPVSGWAQHSTQAGGDHHAQPAANAAVDFGVLPAGPLGPPPCLQTGGIGGPADPCAYLTHRLTPEEVTVGKGGQVTFQVHGGG